MLIAFIFLVNFLAVAIAFFLRWRGYRTAYIWLLLVVTVFVEWIILALTRIPSFKPLLLSNWFGVGSTPVALRFEMTKVNWPWVFTVHTLILSFLLTSVARLDVKKDLKLWGLVVIQAAFSSLALLARDLWSLVMMWTALDLFDIFFKLVFIQTVDRQYLERSLMIRFAGSLLLILNTASLAMLGVNPAFDNLAGIGRNSLTFAAFLHSGIIPVQNSDRDSQKSPPEKIIDQFFRIMIMLVSFSLVANIPAPQVVFPIDLGVSIFLFFLVVLFGLTWSDYGNSSFNEHSEPLFLASFILYLLFNNGNLTYWLPAIFLPISLTHFYTHRGRSTLFIPILILPLVAGLPYALNAFDVRAFTVQNPGLFEVLTIIPLVILLGGALAKWMHAGERMDEMDMTIQTVYLVGVFLPVLASGIIALKYLGPPASEFGMWWLGVAVFIGTAGFVVLVHRHRKKIKGLTREGEPLLLMKIFTLNWFFAFHREIGKRLSRLVTGFSELLEGAGGILWALVLLVLILSALR